MYCKNCGNNVDDKAVVCPHCGVQVGAINNSQSKDTSNTLAIVGFVLSFFIAIAGLVCSIIGYNKAKNEGANHQGLALAGIIISIVSIVFSIILLIWVNSVVSSLPYYYYAISALF